MWEQLIPAVVSAGANLAGGAMSASGAAGMNAANNANSWGMWNAQRDFAFQQSRDQMEFQREMSNTAYQRATADMRAAGLNPILAYSQCGASSPPGAGHTASGTPAKMENTNADLGRALGSAASSALDTFRGMADVQNATANNALIKEQTEKTKAEAVTTGTQAVKNLADADLTKGQLQNLPQVLKLLTGQTSAAEAAAGQSHAQAEKTRKETEGISPFGTAPLWSPGGNLGVLQNVWRRLGTAVTNAKPSQPVGQRGSDNSFPELWNRFFGK